MRRSYDAEEETVEGWKQLKWTFLAGEGTKASEDLDRKKLVVEEKMVVATMAITRTRFKLYGLERRRFGEFSEVTEESEFQNPAPVTKAINPSRRKVIMDMKMVDTKVVARDEEMVVDTVEVEDGRVGGIQRWRWWLTPE
ncbi:hypothetical protein DY000_02035161 [Brassica cretica]|uniref:Uncharacterized protein n=1 Tax=Brassica cretica TaxID=69181 RepID=A0ABQ7DL32_BRACR|nr:hypothetical protein DY000_02035161 [Brassica cretica]